MDLNQRLTRLRAPLDSDGEPNWRAAEATWSKVDYWGSLQPVGSREDLVSQNRVESSHISRLEPGADITAVDRIRDARGKDYTVDGDPLDWTDVGEYGQQAHWKVFLRRITGG